MLKQIFEILVYIFAAIGFLLVAGYFAVRLGITNTEGIVDLQQESFLAGAGSAGDVAWSHTEEWAVLEAAIRKDTAAINRAAGGRGR